MLSDQM